MFKRILRSRRSLVRGRCRHADLQRCPECKADSVYPVYWESFGEMRWWIALRCGACGTWAEVLVTNATAKRFDRELDRARDEMVLAADRLEHEIMSAQVDVFAAALDCDLIHADDFAD
jgi:hypothetical protein